MTGPDRSREELESALRRLAQTIEFPPPPDYAERVMRQLTDEAAAISSSARTGRLRMVSTHGMRRLLVAAALVLITGAAVIAIPGTRHALASWFDFTGIDIRTAPSSSSTPQLTPAPLSAGRQITLEEAQHAATNRLALPADLPRPDRIYLRRDGAALIVTLAYRTASTLKPTPDTGYALIVTEIFHAGEPVLEKILRTGSTATSVQVSGRPGVFVEGPQEIINVEHSSANGTVIVHEVDPRASANTLIWSDNNATYRLEGDFTQQLALDLANGFH